MKAAYILQPGPANSIQYGELPTPEPSATQCRVRVGAVDVNPIDVYVRAGMIPAKLPSPYILGRDLAGTIDRVGSEVRRFRVGDRVWATGLGTDGRQGTFAEFAVAEEDELYSTPENVSDEDAVALSLVGMTAWIGLRSHARLQAGEILFVDGGTGGVGSSVVQMAKILGARVVTTAGSNEKAALARELGADLAINYRTQDVDAELRSFAPQGVNVWWETLREPDFERTIPLLAKRGRMIVMAGRDAKPVFPVGPFYVKDCSLHGFAVFNAPAEELQTAANEINGWLGSGRLRSRIDRVLPLSEAAQAHQLQEDSTVHRKSVLAGKIVLKP